MKLLLTLYNFLLIIFTPFIAIILYPLLKKRKRHQFYFERFGFIKIKKELIEDLRPTVWFHAASVGEVRSIKPITDLLKENNIKIAVTTMTATGRNEAINYIGADFASLIPLENNRALQEFIKELGVKITVIVDTELWPNLIYTASSYSTLILINARISDRTFKSYKRLSFIFKPLLLRFSAICAKSTEDAERFQSIAPIHKNIIPLGNIKFQSRKSKEEILLKSNEEEYNFFSSFKYFLIASSHDSEEETLINFIFNNNTLKELGFQKVVIAPRHIERSSKIKEMIEEKGIGAGIYSHNETDKTVLIVDKFGILDLLYLNAEKIFIGGSLVNIGGHNIYEALQFRKCVAVGEFMQAFKEIYVDASNLNLVQTVKNEEDLISFLKMNEDDKNENFDKFFNLIDSRNNNVIKILFDIIYSTILK